MTLRNSVLISGRTACQCPMAVTETLNPPAVMRSVPALVNTTRFSIRSAGLSIEKVEAPIRRQGATARHLAGREKVTVRALLTGVVIKDDSATKRKCVSSLNAVSRGAGHPAAAAIA